MSFLPFDPKLIEYNFGVAISEDIHDLIFDQMNENGWNNEDPIVELVSYDNPRLPDTVKSFEPWNSVYEDIPLKRKCMPTTNVG